MLTVSERLWAEASSDFVLEVSVGDYGLGVPVTLWQAYRRAFPDSFDSLQRESKALGTKAGQMARAQLQRAITHWAFEHDSTRKEQSDFPHPSSQFNWRGLHRAANIIADVQGAIIIRSGQARAGYAFHDNRGIILDIPDKLSRNEFPGTTVSLRIPIPKRETRKPRVTLEGSFQLRPQPIGVVTANSARKELGAVSPGEPKLLMICHPFTTLQVDACESIFDLVRQIPPTVIQVHAYAQLAAPVILSQFHGFKDDLDTNIPRLICFWCPGKLPVWKFVGLMPSLAREFIEAVEIGETVPVPPQLEDFAQALCFHYSPYIVLDQSQLRLSIAGCDFGEAKESEVLQLSFEQFVGNGAPEWLTDSPGTLIRLRSGRLVKRYINVLELLHSNDLLAQAVGRRLSLMVESIQRDNAAAQVITDSEASYFLARHLLKEQGLRINMRTAGDMSHSHGPAIMFCDAVYRGATIRSFAAQQAKFLAAVCAVDLRKEGESKHEGLRIHSILRLPFDPQEVSEADAGLAERILEIDHVILSPGLPVDLSQYAIGTSKDRNRFITDHPELIRYGIHLSSGRVQVVSHSRREMVSRHGREIARWVVDEVMRAPSIKGATASEDFVLFARSDSSVQELILPVTEILRQEYGKRVYSSTVAAAPSKSRQIFARVDPVHGVLNDLQIVGAQGEFGFSAPENYLAILLDDSTVTGKSVRNFMMLAAQTKAKSRPRALAVIPVFTRLSPTEDYLYRTFLRTLGSGFDEFVMPFAFVPLFRLNIRSYDDLESTPVYRYLSHLMKFEGALGTRLGTHLTEIQQRLEYVAKGYGRDATSDLVYTHPFSPDSISQSSYSVSHRTVWIRQLISLHEQNIAVLGELLHQIRKACTEEDFSLLTMFAVEPVLTELRPIERSCGEDIRDLALRALRKAGTVGIKSDALIALFHHEIASPAIVSEAAALVEGEGALVDQLLLMMFGNHSSGLRMSSEIANAITSRLTLKENVGYVEASLKTWNEIRQENRITGVAEAVMAVIDAFSNLIYHTLGAADFNGPTTWVQSSIVARARQPWEDVRSIFRAALSSVRDHFLPAIRGLEFIARSKQYGPSGQALHESFVRLSELVAHLEEKLSHEKSGPVGESDAEDIESSWTDIRLCTQFTPPQKYLALSALPDQYAGTFETCAPDYFCLPFDAASSGFPTINRVRVTADWQETPGNGVNAILLGAPLKDYRELVSNLFGDANKHGNGEITAHFTRVLEEGFQLKLTVTNVVSGVTSRGSGKSQKKVQELASRNSWKVVFPESAVAGKEYAVEVFFSNTFELRG